MEPGARLRVLCWCDVRTRTLLVTAAKTQNRRTVRLLVPLAEDLAAWRRTTGDPGPDALLFPAEDGGLWAANGFEKWRARRYRILLALGGRRRGRPYDLRHSFASLLLHEGRDDAPQLSAEEAILRAREDLRRKPCTRFVRVPGDSSRAGSRNAC